MIEIFYAYKDWNPILFRTDWMKGVKLQYENDLKDGKCPTLAKTELLYPKNAGA